jgi:hypothetical protein
LPHGPRWDGEALPLASSPAELSTNSAAVVERVLLRGIPFRLTFAEWWKIWKDSGLYHLRGRFVMHRINDEGPYAVGNVEIISKSDNFREAMEVYYMGERKYI